MIDRIQVSIFIIFLMVFNWFIITGSFIDHTTLEEDIRILEAIDAKYKDDIEYQKLVDMINSATEVIDQNGLPVVLDQ